VQTLASTFALTKGDELKMLNEAVAHRYAIIGTIIGGIFSFEVPYFPVHGSLPSLVRNYSTSCYRARGFDLSNRNHSGLRWYE
jgi:hypothetical protein